MSEGNEAVEPRTYESGPSDPVRLADGPGTWVELDISAPATVVWELVIDINLPAEHSAEFTGADWEEPPGPGGRFVGRNTHPAIGEWEVPCFVDAWEPERAFGWRTSDPADPGARWRFDLAPTESGTRLRYSVILGPGFSGLTMAISSMPDKEPRIIERRLSEHHRNMTSVVEGIRDRAEAASQPA